jgi:signal transduction histidine kinase
MTSDFYHSSLEFPAGNTSLRSPAKERMPVTKQVMAAYMMLLNLGTEFIKDNKQLKYIKICNFAAMTSCLAAIIYIVLSIAWQNPLWFIAVNSLCITSIGVLYLNRIGRIYISRILYLVVVDTLLFIIALILGPYTHGENFLLIAVLIPFLMFDLEHMKLIIMGVTIPIVFITLYPYLESFFSPYNLSVAHQNVIRVLGIPMEVGLAITAIFQFLYYSRKTEIELESSNQQLTVHTTELKKSNADLEQFAYVISHDLKTPVRNISCFMKLLLNKHAIALDAEAKEFVDFALNGSKRMERLIDDVLAYSRIGRNLSISTAVNVNDVINTIRYELDGKTSNATIIVDHELPIVNSVHSSLLYHIFQNLIRNGLKFNNSEHPEVVISCGETTENYMFSVADNGIGIPKQYAPQIFQMFKRLHNENEYDGTGIGLAICKKIVELYNGEIWFESDGSHGTTFYFTIRKF